MSVRQDVAREVFVWGLPTVSLYSALHELVLEPARTGQGNRLNRVLPRPHPDRRAGPSGPPVLGTWSCCAWLDLRRGPVYLDVVPDAAAGPAVATLLDLYAEVVGQVPDAHHTHGHSFLVVGPSWEPPARNDAAAVLRCRTDLCLALGWPSAESLSVRPMTDEGRTPLPLPPPVPPVDVRRPPTLAFLTVLDWMLHLMPTRPGEEDFRGELEVVGLACGQAARDEVLTGDRIDGEVTAGLRQGFEEIRRAQMSSSARPRRTASWARATDNLR